MHPKAEREFDQQAGRMFDEVVSLAFAVALLMSAGWCVGVWLAHWGENKPGSFKHAVNPAEMKSEAR